MLLRERWIELLTKRLNAFRIVGLLGPRQCGKTTLARQIASAWPGFEPKLAYFDLEDPRDVARLENPMLALSELEGLIVIDEIQRRPGLFEILRVLSDRPDQTAKFLVLGSASRDLIQKSSESLAGRIHYLELTPLNIVEVGERDLKKLWIRGGFPESFLATDDTTSFLWRQSFLRTFTEQDVPEFGYRIQGETLRRFWTMLAHYHGQVLNASELGRSFGVSHHTVRNYLEILSGTLMVRQLLPWHKNVGKRLMKLPKIYIRDSGIFHRLMGIGPFEDLAVNPRIGASWEGFALEEVTRALGTELYDYYFWGVHEGSEVDLLAVQGDSKRAFEFKYADSPKATKGTYSAIKDLELDELTIVYPGPKSYRIEERIRVIPLSELIQELAT